MIILISSMEYPIINFYSFIFYYPFYSAMHFSPNLHILLFVISYSSSIYCNYNQIAYRNKWMCLNLWYQRKTRKFKIPCKKKSIGMKIIIRIELKCSDIINSTFGQTHFSSSSSFPQNNAQSIPILFKNVKRK